MTALQLGSDCNVSLGLALAPAGAAGGAGRHFTEQPKTYITIHLEEPDLQDGMFTAEQVKDWLNVINGEGTGGGPINPILSDRWTEGDVSDPRH